MSNLLLLLLGDDFTFSADMNYSSYTKRLQEGGGVSIWKLELHSPHRSPLGIAKIDEIDQIEFESNLKN